MIVRFDSYNKKRTPFMMLCNPNGEELCSLKGAYDREVSLNLMEISDFSFNVDKTKETKKMYNLLKTKRIVHVEDVGCFIITSVSTTREGFRKTKHVVAKSLEYELVNKTIGVIEGTYRFYDPLSKETLLSTIMSLIPHWSLESVDSSLWNVHRTFEDRSTNVYNFLLAEVQKTYECVFIFNTIKRTIKVKALDNILKETDIFMSNRKLIKDLNIEEDAENIVTALDIYGDGDLSISSVNPLGTNTIYDFSYYKTTEWMSQRLIDALNAWELKIKNHENTYGEHKTQLKQLKRELLELNTEKIELETEKKVLEQKHEMAVIAGDNASCTKYKQEIQNKQNEINLKQQEITNKETEIKQIQSSIVNTSNELSFENNFTEDEYKELSLYIYQSSVTDSTFSTHESDTDEEQQEVAQALYEWGKRHLKKYSQPKLGFSINSVNFSELVEYRQYTSELELGSKITVEVDRETDDYPEVVLLGMSYSFDDKETFELRFHNDLNINNLTLLELLEQTSTISNNMDWISPSISLGKEVNDKFNNYVENALDLTKQDLISSDNQEFVINNLGIRGKEKVGDGYSDEQVWMTKNILAFSDDGFQTVKQAIGKTYLPDGTTGYGMIADFLIGKIMYTSTLVAENENGSFRVDGSKVTIKDGDILMTNEDGEVVNIKDFLQEQIDKIDMSKLDNILTPEGFVDTSKMFGDILTGKNNILCIDEEDGKALLLNESGILIANTKTGELYNWSTAITGDGIHANNLIGKMIYSSTLVCENENGTFKVDGSSVTIKNGNILMTNTEGKDVTLEEFLEEQLKDIDLSRLDNVLTDDGLLDTSKMQGDILSGTNNILCIDISKTKALILNERGILISNSKDNEDNWIWSTAISGDGINASVIQTGQLNTSKVRIQDELGLTRITGGKIQMYGDTDEKSLLFESGVDNTGAFNFTINNIDGTPAIYMDSQGYIKVNGQIDADVSVSDSMYSDMGYVSDMTVNSINTADYIARYLNRDTSSINYQRQYENKLEFINAQCTGGTQQLKDYKNRLLYWLRSIEGADIVDGAPYIDGRRIGVTHNKTDYPVIVFDYKEYVKRKLSFDSMGVPYDIHGVGTESNDSLRGKVVIQKETTDFKMVKYHDSKDEISSGIILNDNGLKIIGGSFEPQFVKIYNDTFEITSANGDKIVKKAIFDETGKIKAIQSDNGKVMGISIIRENRLSETDEVSL